MNLNQWLEKPYPLFEQLKEKLILATCFALFTYVFLMIYQPFGTDKIIKNKSLFLLGFGICVFLGIVVNYIIIPKLFPSIFRSDQWQIKKEIIYLFWGFLLIGLFNYSYNTLIGKGISTYHNLLEFIGITFSVGIFPLLGLIYFIEINQNKKYTLQAELLSKSISEDKVDSEESKLISIQSETLKSEPFKFNMSDFVFATSDNNYTTIFYESDGKLNQELMRLSIKNLESQLTQFKNIVRCHRSYIVNKQKIKSIEGNARSLALNVENYGQGIPVSRSFPKEQLV